jgi:tripartite-type tricarboxylate transporter receptor subunit TctC
MRLPRRAALSLLASPAFAQSWPNRPLRIIVPFPPGGGVDLTARLLSEPLARELGQTVVIENRGGAGGVIGVEAMSRAPADGYTLSLTGAGTIPPSDEPLPPPPADTVWVPVPLPAAALV